MSNQSAIMFMMFMRSMNDVNISIGRYRQHYCVGNVAMGNGTEKSTGFFKFVANYHGEVEIR